MTNGNISSEIMQLRSQGLDDNMIKQELVAKGVDPAEVDQALSGSDDFSAGIPAMSEMPEPSSGVPSPEGGIYERMEQIAESMIDAKWEDLIAEVKKIVEWKETIEERQNKMQAVLDKLKEDFSTLHQGVLGKLEDYDTRMRDVGTELNAVGKVFKDVIPEFVENVKELKGMTKK